MTAITFRIDDNLASNFKDYCQKNRYSVTQVLSLFMSHCIENKLTIKDNSIVPIENNLNPSQSNDLSNLDEKIKAMIIEQLNLFNLDKINNKLQQIETKIDEDITLTFDGYDVQLQQIDERLTSLERELDTYSDLVMGHLLKDDNNDDIFDDNSQEITNEQTDNKTAAAATNNEQTDNNIQNCIAAIKTAINRRGFDYKELNSILQSHGFDTKGYDKYFPKGLLPSKGKFSFLRNIIKYENFKWQLIE